MVLVLRLIEFLESVGISFQVFNIISHFSSSTFVLNSHSVSFEVSNYKQTSFCCALLYCGLQTLKLHFLQKKGVDLW